jgi:hypothetical protein
VDRPPSACAEFPNDNPSLHRGAIWFCAELGAAPVFEGPAQTVAEREVEAVAEPICEAISEPISEPIAEAVAEAVAEPVVERVVERVVEPVVEPVAEPIAEPVAEPATDPAPVVVDADDETDDIEIVEDLAFDDAVDESIPPPPLAAAEPEEPAAPGDPYLTLVRVLEDVATSAGAGDAALTTLRTLLGQLRIETGASPDHQRLRAQALAWQGILRGESEDFSACGPAMLDEWSAALVALAVGQPARAETLKRELRRRGVAAFGLVDQAA